MFRCLCHDHPSPKFINTLRGLQVTHDCAIFCPFIKSTSVPATFNRCGIPNRKGEGGSISRKFIIPIDVATTVLRNAGLKMHEVWPCLQCACLSWSNSCRLLKLGPHNGIHSSSSKLTLPVDWTYPNKPHQYTGLSKINGANVERIERKHSVIGWLAVHRQAKFPGHTWAGILQ